MFHVPYRLTLMAWSCDVYHISGLSCVVWDLFRNTTEWVSIVGRGSTLSSMMWPLRTRCAWTGHSQTPLFLIQSMFYIDLFSFKSLFGLLSPLHAGKRDITKKREHTEEVHFARVTSISSLYIPSQGSISFCWNALNWRQCLTYWYAPCSI